MKASGIWERVWYWFKWLLLVVLTPILAWFIWALFTGNLPTDKGGYRWEYLNGTFVQVKDSVYYSPTP